MDDGPKESKRKRLAAGVAAGLSVRRAAREADLTHSAARRALAHESTKQLVAMYAKEMDRRAIGCYSRLIVKASRRLNKLLDSTDEEIALKAVRGVVADSLALREGVDFAERLGELEARLATAPKNGGYHVD
jgi:hypothetical protein